MFLTVISISLANTTLDPSTKVYPSATKLVAPATGRSAPVGTVAVLDPNASVSLKSITLIGVLPLVPKLNSRKFFSNSMIGLDALRPVSITAIVLLSSAVWLITSMWNQRLLLVHPFKSLLALLIVIKSKSVGEFESWSKFVVSNELKSNGSNSLFI